MIHNFYEAKFGNVENKTTLHSYLITIQGIYPEDNLPTIESICIRLFIAAFAFIAKYWTQTNACTLKTD